MRRILLALAPLLAMPLAAQPALANSEAVAIYNARSLGMGGTGAAYVDNTTAVLHNPANLTDIKRLTIDVAFMPELIKQTSRVVDSSPAGRERSTNTILSPLGFVGLAVRVHPRLVIGAAGLISDAQAVHYGDTPMSIFGDPRRAGVLGSARAAVLNYELRIPVAIKITDWLSVAGGYRMSFANQIADFDVGSTRVINRRLSGQNYASAQAGVMVRPLPQLQLGLSYRSRAKITMHGTQKVLNGTTVVAADESSTYVVPHQFTVGAALKSRDQRMMLTGDFKYWMFSDAYPGLHTHRDAFSGHVGAEYRIAGWIPVRLGYLVGRSAVPKEAASALAIPPGLEMGGTLGAGVRLSWVDIDAAVAYGGVGGTIDDSPLPGRYQLQLIGLGASASFRL